MCFGAGNAEIYGGNSREIVRYFSLRVVFQDCGEWFFKNENESSQAKKDDTLLCTTRFMYLSPSYLALQILHPYPIYFHVTWIRSIACRRRHWDLVAVFHTKNDWNIPVSLASFFTDWKADIVHSFATHSDSRWNLLHHWGEPSSGCHLGDNMWSAGIRKLMSVIIH